MTLAKRLLLGTAAAFVATSGAHAADLGLPVAPSVDYVQICSIGSFTGFILPGGDVCFDISGYARGQYTWSEEIDPFQYSLVPGTGTGTAAVPVIDLTGIDIEAGDTTQNVVLYGETVAIALDGTVTQPEVYDALDRAAALAAGYSALVQFTEAGNSIDIAAGALDIAARAGISDSLTFNTAGVGFAAGDVLTGYGALMNTLLATTGNNDEGLFEGNARLNFDARTMTEYGLLRGFIRLDGENGTAANVDRAFVQLNVGSIGFTAGLADSVFDPVFTGYGSGAAQGLGLADQASNQFSVNAAVGNGVTVSLSVEDDDARTDDSIVTMGSNLAGTVFAVGLETADAGNAMPDVVAAIRVDQAWGSAKLAAALSEVNSSTAGVSSEWGFAVSASAEINIPFGVGSTFGITGIYADGAQGFMGFNNTVGNSATGYANAVLFDADTAAAGPGSLQLTTSYVLAAGFNFGVSDMISLSIDGSYADVDHFGSVFDGNVWTVRGGIAYTPVNNLTINAHVSYAASDFQTSSLRSSVDDDEWGARFRVTRSF